MPNERIQAILTELSANAPTSRANELLVELTDLLTLAVTIENKSAKDADVRLKHVGFLYRNLRSELRTIERQVKERDEIVSAKLHQLGNAFMGLEERLMEIADAIELISDEDNVRARIIGTSIENIIDDNNTTI